MNSSQANAEVSNAKTALTNAKDFEQELSNQLAQLLAVAPADFILDNFFVLRIPEILQNTASTADYPLLQSSGGQARCLNICSAADAQ